MLAAGWGWDVGARTSRESRFRTRMFGSARSARRPASLTVEYDRLSEVSAVRRRTCAIPSSPTAVSDRSSSVRLRSLPTCAIPASVTWHESSDTAESAGRSARAARPVSVTEVYERLRRARLRLPARALSAASPTFGQLSTRSSERAARPAARTAAAGFGSAVPSQQLASGEIYGCDDPFREWGAERTHPRGPRCLRS